MVIAQTNYDIGEFEFPLIPIRIEAHRGAGRLEAENSLQAFARSIELGLDGIETDVWLTKDKVPIIVHGTMGEQRGLVYLKEGLENISLIESANLKNYTLKNGEKMLTLAEGLEFCRDKIHLNIEFKDSREEIVERTLDVIEEAGMLDQVSFSSFNHSYRKRLTQETARRKIAPVNFGYLSHTYNLRFPNYKTTLAGDTLNLDIRYLEKSREKALQEINTAKKHGVLVKIWFPVQFENETLYYQDLMKIGVNTIITNDPLDALDYFETEQLKHSL